jgi:hypothetical protein
VIVFWFGVIEDADAVVVDLEKFGGSLEVVLMGIGPTGPGKLADAKMEHAGRRNLGSST